MERAAKKKHLPFLTSLTKSKQRYATDIKLDDFIEMAYDVWRSIGNIATVTNRFFSKVPDDSIIELPQQAEMIKSVTSVDQKAIITTFDSGGRKDRHVPGSSVRSNLPNKNQSITTSPGASINYILLDNNSIRITAPEMKGMDVMVVYNSMDLDDDGLPLLNDKEVEAIAAEVARRLLTRKLFQGVGPSANNALVTMLQVITVEADRLMVAAKIDEKITDDALDKMMDIKTSWDRKVYNRRFNLVN